MKIEYQDRIENYLSNRMSDSDREAFEQDLEKDVELREQYEFISMVKTALMLENVKKDVCKWTKAYKERETAAIETQEVGYKATGSGYDYYPVQSVRKARSMTQASGRKLFYWLSGIAAVLVVGVFVFSSSLIYFSSSSQKMAKESTPIPASSSPKRDCISFKGHSQTDIESLLARGDYSKALAQIEKYEVQIKNKEMQHEREEYSRGNCQKATAEKTGSSENRLVQLLYWKANALIGLNRIDEAVILLEEIRHSDSMYKEEADSLYNVLKKK